MAGRLLGGRALGRRSTLGRLRTHLARVVGAPEPPPLEGDRCRRPMRPDGGHAANAAAEPDPAGASRAAFIIDYAARITRVPGDARTPLERDFFVYCQKLALTAQPRRRRTTRPPGRAVQPGDLAGRG